MRLYPVRFRQKRLFVCLFVWLLWLIDYRLRISLFGWLIVFVCLIVSLRVWLIAWLIANLCSIRKVLDCVCSVCAFLPDNAVMLKKYKQSLRWPEPVLCSHRRCNIVKPVWYEIKSNLQFLCFETAMFYELCQRKRRKKCIKYVNHTSTSITFNSVIDNQVHVFGKFITTDSCSKSKLVSGSCWY